MRFTVQSGINVRFICCFIFALNTAAAFGRETTTIEEFGQQRQKFFKTRDVREKQDAL